MLVNLQSQLGAAIWYPGQTQAEWAEEISASAERSHIINAFLRDEVEVDSFLDWVAEEFEDPFAVFQDLPQPEEHPWGLILP